MSADTFGRREYPVPSARLESKLARSRDLLRLPMVEALDATPHRHRACERSDRCSGSPGSATRRQPNRCRAACRRPRRLDSGRPGRRGTRRPPARPPARGRLLHGSVSATRPPPAVANTSENQNALACVAWPEGKLEPVTACRCSTGGRGRATSSLIQSEISIAPPRLIATASASRRRPARAKPR